MVFLSLTGQMLVTPSKAKRPGGSETLSPSLLSPRSEEFNLTGWGGAACSACTR
jgi:hypothetical protein